MGAGEAWQWGDHVDLIDLVDLWNLTEVGSVGYCRRQPAVVDKERWKNGRNWQKRTQNGKKTVKIRLETVKNGLKTVKNGWKLDVDQGCDDSSPSICCAGSRAAKPASPRASRI